MIKLNLNLKLFFLIKVCIISLIICLKSYADDPKIQKNMITIGSYDAMVKIKVFSSLTCPHCANFHIKVIPDIKKKYVSLFIFSPTTEEVEEKEKKSPSSKRKINKNKICLSIFLHHFATKLVFSLLKLNILPLFKFFYYQIFKIVSSIFKIIKLIKRCCGWTEQNSFL